MAYKILIVDDEKMMTELLSDHLRDCDYETITANDSREAIELLQKNPDLIILDINMPDGRFGVVSEYPKSCGLSDSFCHGTDYRTG